ncbi:hypothetical protein AC249_AIPGENE25645 [Exaiptasia diaphana]|nr:hypothetical protein AC249_AIPGENE25645 [Exaiptasia diaphana]
MLSPIEIANATNEIVDQASALNVLEALKPMLHNEIKAKTKAFTLSGTHHPSNDLLPIGFKSWTPINSTGNGNCLYNSVSLILVGDETLAPMLRLLTKAELTAYSAYYADNPQLHAIALDGAYSFKSLIHIMISDDEANEIYDGNTNNINLAIEHLAFLGGKPYVYSSPFHVMALTSVIGCPIFSVYPELSATKRIFKVLHRCLQPRQGVQINRETIYIMWTRVTRGSLKNWTPNHFVPLQPPAGESHLKHTHSPSMYKGPVSSGNTQAPPSKKSSPIPSSRTTLNATDCPSSSDASSDDSLPSSPPVSSKKSSGIPLSKTTLNPTEWPPLQAARHKVFHRHSKKDISSPGDRKNLSPPLSHVTSAKTRQTSTPLPKNKVASQLSPVSSDVSSDDSLPSSPPAPFSKKSSCISSATTTLNPTDWPPLQPARQKVLPRRSKKDISSPGKEKNTSTSLPHSTSATTLLYSTPLPKCKVASRVSPVSSDVSSDDSLHSSPPELGISNISVKTKSQPFTDLSPPVSPMSDDALSSGFSPSLKRRQGKKNKSITTTQENVKKGKVSKTTSPVPENKAVKEPFSSPESSKSSDLSNPSSDDPSSIPSPKCSSSPSKNEKSKIATLEKFNKARTSTTTTSKVPRNKAFSPVSSPTLSASSDSSPPASPLSDDASSSASLPSPEPSLRPTTKENLKNSKAQKDKKSELSFESIPRLQRKRRTTDKDNKTAALKKMKPCGGQPSIRNFFNSPKVSTAQKVKDLYRKRSSPSLKELLPLRGPGLSWYKNVGRKARKNYSRSLCNNSIDTSTVYEGGDLKGMVNNKVKGTINENVNNIIGHLNKQCSRKQQMHFRALLTIAEHILQKGPIVRTQELIKLYKEEKDTKSNKAVHSSEFFRMISRFLNVMQIYIHGRAYILENRGYDIQSVIDSVVSTGKSEENVINERLAKTIGNELPSALKYLDSKRDRDTVKALVAKITSVKCAMKLSRVQDKRSIRGARNIVFSNIKKFEQMSKEVSLSEKDKKRMGPEQQRRKINRLLEKEKLKNLRHVYEGRGRNLKCDEFPELASVLEYVYGEGDRIDRAGGGLESHPRLTDTMLYRAADNNTIMRQARETILALAPEGFDISLSSCFNYTQNYKAGTYQARRHHAGRGINACISLHKPPRTGVEKFVINLHWTTKNVNLTLDVCKSNPKNVLVDSKDAKTAILSDVSPVQKPGKTWKKIELPDHDWQRSTKNTITPMTHLFVETQERVVNEKLTTVKRTGQAATILNLTYFEPHTVHRLFSDFLLLLLNPSLDSIFRNPDTGRLKEHFVFIVDNGPGEAPSSSLVGMWLVRLTRMLQLKSVAQKSFAEYHSKRNFVERVHAVHNTALSYDVFKSNRIHSNYSPGDSNHKANMEAMASDVKSCLDHTQYGGKPCVVQRGSDETEFMFKDGLELENFIAKSECNKEEDDTNFEPAADSKLWEELCTIWGLKHQYVGSYYEDYMILNNTFHEEGIRTCWRDKYSCVIYNPDLMSTNEEEKYFEIQPIPDYVRWFDSGGELHYLSQENANAVANEISAINETPAMYLPSKILGMMFKAIQDPKSEALSQIALLSWCTEVDVQEFYKLTKKRLDEEFESDKEREYWGQHMLYRENQKAQLEQMAIKHKLPFEGKKHELVKRLVEYLELARPEGVPEYKGDLQSIPSFVKELNSLSVYRLKEILRYHNLLTCGTKDELILRVGMLKAGRRYLAFQREFKGLSNLISITKKVVNVQKNLWACKLENDIVMKREYSTPSGPSLTSKRPRENASRLSLEMRSEVPVPDDIAWGDLENMFSSLENELHLCKSQTRKIETMKSVPKARDNFIDKIKIKGKRLLVHWTKEEIGSTGWKQGWYAGVVKGEEEGNVILVEFEKEQGEVYKYNLNDKETRNKIKLAKESGGSIDDYQGFFGVGSKLQVHWSDEELGDSGWSKGCLPKLHFLDLQMAEIRQLLNIIEQLERKLGLDSGHINKLRMEKESLYDELRQKTSTFDAWDSMMSTSKCDHDGSSN